MKRRLNVLALAGGVLLLFQGTRTAPVWAQIQAQNPPDCCSQTPYDDAPTYPCVGDSSHNCCDNPYGTSFYNVSGCEGTTGIYNIFVYRLGSCSGINPADCPGNSNPTCNGYDFEEWASDPGDCTGAPSCVSSGGTCTSASQCCSGLTCIFTNGSGTGTCQPCVSWQGETCTPAGAPYACGSVTCNGSCSPECGQDYDCWEGETMGACVNGCCEFNVGYQPVCPCGTDAWGNCIQDCDPTGYGGACSDMMGGECNGCGTIQCDGSCDTSGCSNGFGDPCATAGCEYSCIDVYYNGQYWAECQSADPIVIDLDSDSYSLTNLQNGVRFDFYGNGKPIQLAWTVANSNTGWLALDRNRNGRIDNGWELFSNVSFQPGPAGSHLGFKALQMYDTKPFGGNGDGVIDAKDAIYPKLRIWLDKNHNGISESGELLTLPQAGIASISVNYQKANWTDAFGNQFQNKAKIVRANGNNHGNGDGQDHWAYDVTLVTTPGK